MSEELSEECPEYVLMVGDIDMVVTEDNEFCLVVSGFLTHEELPNRETRILLRDIDFERFIPELGQAMRGYVAIAEAEKAMNERGES